MTNPKRSKRARVLAAIEEAGTCNDNAAFTRLYIENRVSFQVAREAFRRGAAWARWIAERDVAAKQVAS